MTEERKKINWYALANLRPEATEKERKDFKPGFKSGTKDLVQSLSVVLINGGVTEKKAFNEGDKPGKQITLFVYDIAKKDTARIFLGAGHLKRSGTFLRDLNEALASNSFMAISLVPEKGERFYLSKIASKAAISKPELLEAVERATVEFENLNRFLEPLPEYQPEEEIIPMELDV